MDKSQEDNEAFILKGFNFSKTELHERLRLLKVPLDPFNDHKKALAEQYDNLMKNQSNRNKIRNYLKNDLQNFNFIAIKKKRERHVSKKKEKKEGSEFEKPQRKESETNGNKKGKKKKKIVKNKSIGKSKLLKEIDIDKISPDFVGSASQTALDSNRTKSDRSFIQQVNGIKTHRVELNEFLENLGKKFKGETTKKPILTNGNNVKKNNEGSRTSSPEDLERCSIISRPNESFEELKKIDDDKNSRKEIIIENKHSNGQNSTGKYHK